MYFERATHPNEKMQVNIIAKSERVDKLVIISFEQFI